jgi:hypothetical protein
VIIAASVGALVAVLAVIIGYSMWANATFTMHGKIRFSSPTWTAADSCGPEFLWSDWARLKPGDRVLVSNPPDKSSAMATSTPAPRFPVTAVNTLHAAQRSGG